MCVDQSSLGCLLPLSLKLISILRIKISGRFQYFVRFQTLQCVPPNHNPYPECYVLTSPERLRHVWKSNCHKLHTLQNQFNGTAGVTQLQGSTAGVKSEIRDAGRERGHAPPDSSIILRTRNDSRGMDEIWKNVHQCWF